MEQNNKKNALKSSSDPDKTDKRGSMYSLITWNVNKAVEKNPSLDLKLALTEAQNRLDKQNVDEISSIVQYPQHERHLTCAVLAWHQLGHKTTGSLYEFIHTKMFKKEELENMCDKVPTKDTESSIPTGTPESPVLDDNIHTKESLNTKLLSDTRLVVENNSETGAPNKSEIILKLKQDYSCDDVLGIGGENVFRDHVCGPLPVDTKIVMWMEPGSGRGGGTSGGRGGGTSGGRGGRGGRGGGTSGGRGGGRGGGSGGSAGGSGGELDGGCCNSKDKRTKNNSNENKDCCKKKPNQDTKKKLDAACCLESACIGRLAELDAATKELRLRAARLSRRENERVELLERAEAAWRDLEHGYERRIAAAKEKEEDIKNKMKALVDERNRLKDVCHNLTEQLSGKGGAIEKEKTKLQSLEKQVCELAVARHKLSDETSKRDAELSGVRIKISSQERDLLFKENQLIRQIATYEREAEIPRSISYESERAFRSEMSGIKAQVEQVSRQLIAQDTLNLKLTEEINLLQNQKENLAEDVDVCKEKCDNNMKKKTDAINKKRMLLMDLHDKVVECRCKLPKDAVVEVKRTPSFAAMCVCDPGDRLVNKCSCTSVRSHLLATLISELFSGLRSELDDAITEMPCVLLKCLEDSYKWEKASPVKTKVEQYFAKLLVKELDISIANIIENYRAQWIGTTCADTVKYLIDPEDTEPGWEQRVIERRAQKLADKLAEQMFDKRADELTERARKAFQKPHSGPYKPCACKPPSKHHSPERRCSTMQYACAVTENKCARPKRTVVNDVNVSELRAEIQELKKNAVKKTDLRTLQNKLDKVAKLAEVPSKHLADSICETENLQLTLRNKAVTCKSKHDKKLVDKTPINEQKSKIVSNSKGVKKVKPSYAVNLCLCSNQKDNLKKPAKCNKDEIQKSLMRFRNNLRSNRSSPIRRRTSNINPECCLIQQSEITYEESNENDCNCLHKTPTTSSIDHLLNTLTLWKDDLIVEEIEADHQVDCICLGNNAINDLKLMRSNIKNYTYLVEQATSPIVLTSTDRNKSLLCDRASTPLRVKSTIRHSICACDQENSNQDSVQERISNDIPNTVDSVYIATINLDNSDESCFKCRENVPNYHSDIRNKPNKERIIIDHQLGQIDSFFDDASEESPVRDTESFQNKDNLCLRSPSKNFDTKKPLNIEYESKFSSILPDMKLSFNSNVALKGTAESSAKRESEEYTRINDPVNSTGKKYLQPSALGNKLPDVTPKDRVQGTSGQIDNPTMEGANTNNYGLSKSQYANINNVVKHSNLFPEQCDYNIKILGITLNDSNKTTKFSDIPYERKTIATNSKAPGSKEINEPFNAGDATSSKNIQISISPNINRNSMSTLTAPQSIVCDNPIEEIVSKNLEENMFELLSEHLRKKLDTFKQNTCQNLTKAEEETIYSSIINKVKNVLSSGTKQLTCECSNSNKLDGGSWSRVHGLLQEYIRIKMKRLKCSCKSKELKNEDEIFPELLNKICCVMESDFERLKSMFKEEKSNESQPIKHKTTSDKKSFCTSPYCSLVINSLGCVTTPIKQNINSVATSLAELNKDDIVQTSHQVNADKSCEVFQKCSTTQQTKNISQNSFTGHCDLNIRKEYLQKSTSDIQTEHGIKEVKFDLTDDDMNRTCDENLKKLSKNTDNLNVNDTKVTSHNSKPIPYIGYTLECDPSKPCKCAKSAVQAKKTDVENIYNTLVYNKNQVYDYSYILQKNELPSSETGPSGSVTLETEVDLSNYGSIVSKQPKYATVAFGADKNKSNVMFNLCNFDQNMFYRTAVPDKLVSVQDTLNICNTNVEEKELNIEKDDLMKDNNNTNNNHEKKSISESGCLHTKKYKDCTCKLVPLCQVKMLVDNIENELVQTMSCTCESLTSKFCPVHPRKFVQ